MEYEFPPGTEGQTVTMVRYQLAQHAYVAEYDDSADGRQRLQVSWPDDGEHDEAHALAIIDGAASEEGEPQYSEMEKPPGEGEG